MAYKAGETITREFTVTDSDGAITDADSLPTVTEVIDGVDTATSVTVTNKNTGVYKATWTISGSKDEDLAYRIEAAIGGISTAETVGLGKLDSKRIDDLNDISQADANMAADTALAEYDPPTKAELDSAVSSLQGTGGYDLTDVVKRQEADRVLLQPGDTGYVGGGSEWQIAYREAGTSTTLFTQSATQPDGSDVTAETDIIGSLIEAS